MRSIDVFKNVALFFREVHLEETFDIYDYFGDAKELRNAWQKTRIPDKLMTFVATLFNIKKSTFIYYSMELTQDESNIDMAIFSRDKDFPSEKK